MYSHDNPGILVDNTVRKLASRFCTFEPLSFTIAKGYPEPVPIFVPVSLVARLLAMVKDIIPYSILVMSASSLLPCHTLCYDISDTWICSLFVSSQHHAKYTCCQLSHEWHLTHTCPLIFLGYSSLWRIWPINQRLTLPSQQQVHTVFLVVNYIHHTVRYRWGQSQHRQYLISALFNGVWHLRVIFLCLFWFTTELDV